MSDTREQDELEALTQASMDEGGLYVACSACDSAINTDVDGFKMCCDVYFCERCMDKVDLEGTNE